MINASLSRIQNFSLFIRVIFLLFLQRYHDTDLGDQGLNTLEDRLHYIST